ncbi:hypothetical protein GDO86_014125, partial [Hymenochirus boettgeri]
WELRSRCVWFPGESIGAAHKGHTVDMRLVQLLTVTVIRTCTTSQATPIIAAKHPFKVALKAGKMYPWCSCGHSKKQ